jgi:hypothetical protein
MIRQFDKPRFNIPDDVAATWHKRAWYATDDNIILGVVVGLVGNGFTWAVLMESDLNAGFMAIDTGTSLSEEDATAALHDAMRLAHGDR